VPGHACIWILIQLKLRFWKNVSFRYKKGCVWNIIWPLTNPGYINTCWKIGNWKPCLSPSWFSCSSGIVSFSRCYILNLADTSNFLYFILHHHEMGIIISATNILTCFFNMKLHCALNFHSAHDTEPTLYFLFHLAQLSSPSDLVIPRSGIHLIRRSSTESGRTC